MESPFTQLDNFIDVFVGAFFFLGALYSLYGVFSLKRQNKRHDKAMIIYIMILTICLMHIYQVVQQLFTGYFAPFRVWDLLNYIQAMLLLMVLQVLGTHLGTNLRQKYKRLP